MTPIRYTEVHAFLAQARGGKDFSPRSRTAFFSSPPVEGYRNERRGECETGQCRSSVVRLRLIIPGTNELTPDSIQDALRMFLQPIKNDDPRLDFFTMYKRETTEYDTDSMQKHNEDLDTTLIFVRFDSFVHTRC